MELAVKVLQSGISALLEYLSAHVLTCLVPAFFIAGAVGVFVSKASVLKHLGPQANKALSYSVASVSGAILAVCSCTVLPLFGGIYKRGSGIGPAVAFLYSGPAINILAIVYSARLLGYDLGVARALGAIAFSVCIGLLMALIYRKEELSRIKEAEDAFAALSSDAPSKRWWQHLVFFLILVGILAFAASKNWIATSIFVAALGVILWLWFTKEEIVQWLKETLRFVRLIFPWLLLGVFVAGAISALLPKAVVIRYVGGNSLLSNFIASFFGALMYFATLTEVPIVRAFLDLGMGRGPALALLLAGPALSLPNMLVIRSIMGTRKTFTYIMLVILFATLSGYVFGLLAK